MGDVELLHDLEQDLVQVEVPPTRVDILKAGEAAKGEPAFLVFVNATSPEELAEMRKIPPEVMQAATKGHRTNSSSAKNVEEEFYEKRRVAHARKIIHHTTGGTPGNINHILIPAQRVIDVEASPTFKALFKDVDGRLELDLADAPAVAALMFKKCRDEDFDIPISRAATTAAEKYAAELQGKGNA